MLNQSAMQNDTGAQRSWNKRSGPAETLSISPMRTLAFLLIPFLTACCALAQINPSVPQSEISNGLIRVKLYLPDAVNGFYRGTRFDWGGVIADLEYKGHSYYGPWFTGTDPNVSDLIYKGSEIIAGPSTAITGPVDEFNPALGYDDAKVGGTFLKIGVGVLRKQDAEPYNAYLQFPIVNGGRWSVSKGTDSIEFTQELHDPSSGYAYVYEKRISLIKGKPEMVIEHSLKNAGTRAIHANVYDHNFLVLDKQPTSAAFSITFPFEIKADHTPDQKLAEIEKNQLLYRSTFVGEDSVYFNIEGFGKNADDYKIRVDNTRSNVGMSIKGDHPLLKIALWSIRSVIAVEPFVELSIEPGSTFGWKYHYEYYTLPDASKP
jgi:hypothetical protein